MSDDALEDRPPRRPRDPLQRIDAVADETTDEIVGCGPARDVEEREERLVDVGVGVVVAAAARGLLEVSDDPREPGEAAEEDGEVATAREIGRRAGDGGAGAGGVTAPWESGLEVVVGEGEGGVPVREDASRGGAEARTEKGP